MQNTLTQQEQDFINSFQSNFSGFKDKKIVLYGTGVKTKLIVENFNYNFIGLMDKEPENTGKTFFNLKVLTYDEVINNVDLIIILSGDIYFNIIYSRIEFLQKDYNIPIYFCDGTQAKPYEIDANIEQNPYWQKNLTSLKAEIDKNEIISFDIFDTLITRKIIEPVEIWKSLGAKIKDEGDFLRDRIKTEINLRNSATLENIYKELSNKYKISYKDEQKFELEHIVARYDIVEAFNYAKKQKKDVYLITDIYHSKKFIKKVLKKLGIKGYKDILISCELGKRKADKTLWQHYSNIIKGKTALHIGDDLKSDIQNAEEFGINTFHILSPYEMLKNSTIKSIVPNICSFDESMIMGKIISRIFNSPFALSNTRGQVSIDNLENLGYSLFAPILFNYITWILKENLKNKTDKILFVARDGYFLEKLYNFTVKKFKIKNAPKAQYLMISRPMITIINLKDENDIEEALKISFQGKISDYLKIRFGLDIKNERIINTAIDTNEIKEIVYTNKQNILENAKNQRRLYLKYLKTVIKDKEKIALVDPTYNGTNQYFLSKLLDKEINGYYCNANLSDKNLYFKNNMFALFQNKNDAEAKASHLRKHSKFLEEGILVAPTGVCLKINKNLSFQFAQAGTTQKQFYNKEKTYRLVVEYFNDAFLEYNSIEDVRTSSELIDCIFKLFNDEKISITKEIKDTFFIDERYNAIFDKNLFK